MSDVFGLQSVAAAALKYAHNACFTQKVGTLPSDEHLLVLFHNMGSKDLVSKFMFSSPELVEMVWEMDCDGYSGVAVIKGVKPQHKAKLRIAWDEFMYSQVEGPRAA